MKKKIAVFASGWGSAILAQYTQGLAEALKNEPADVFLFVSYPLASNTPENNRGEYSIFSLPKLEDFDGAVIFANSLDSDNITLNLVERCHAAGIPVIAHGREVAGTYSVTVNNYNGMCNMIEHLITCHNVKRILFMAGLKNNADSNERLNATRNTMEKYGLSLDFNDICYTNFDNRRTILETKNRVSKFGKPDAVVCVNDGVAMAVALALEELDLNVPKDIIVTGFDCLKEGQVFYPSLTTINQHFVQLGKESGQLLSDLLAGKFCSKKCEINCHFTLGESCGCQDVSVNDVLRRKAGREAFTDRNTSEMFARKTNALENIFRSSRDYKDLCGNIDRIYTNDTDYEGESFHFIIDPTYSLSVKNNSNEMNESFFSETMESVFSIVEGEKFPKKVFATRNLLPYYPESQNAHLYIFVPLFNGQYTMGYLVFADNVKLIESRSLQRYQEKCSEAMKIFLQTQAMAHLNAELTKLSQLDSLTHVKSRTGFQSREHELEHQMISDPEFEYAIAMFDINNLKTINDTLGHDAGDQYIINCCKLICDTFKYSSVYRIGGDEFVAILTGKDYLTRQKRFEEFDKAIKELDRPDVPMVERVSIASGVAFYSHEVGGSVQDILKKADARMYENKKLMKAGDVRNGTALT